MNAGIGGGVGRKRDRHFDCVGQISGDVVAPGIDKGFVGRQVHRSTINQRSASRQLRPTTAASQFGKVVGDGLGNGAARFEGTNHWIHWAGTKEDNRRIRACASQAPVETNGQQIVDEAAGCSVEDRWLGRVGWARDDSALCTGSL